MLCEVEANIGAVIICQRRGSQAQNIVITEIYLALVCVAGDRGSGGLF